MKNWPTDPMRQHNRLIAAFCDDLFFGDRDMTRSKRVAEINQQINETPSAIPSSNGGGCPPSPAPEDQ